MSFYSRQLCFGMKSLDKWWEESIDKWKDQHHEAFESYRWEHGAEFDQNPQNPVSALKNGVKFLETQVKLNPRPPAKPNSEPRNLQPRFFCGKPKRLVSCTWPAQKRPVHALKLGRVAPFLQFSNKSAGIISLWTAKRVVEKQFLESTKQKGKCALER